MVDDFRYRYFIVTTTQYLYLQHKYKDRFAPTNIPHSTMYCIIDWNEGKSLIYSNRPVKEKTFPLYMGDKNGIGKFDLSFLEPYETRDESILLQSDKITPEINIIKHLYSIGNIWLAYVYITKKGYLRMCVNRNIFGEYKLIDGREMNLREILLSLP